MQKTIEPLDDKVLIKRNEPLRKTPGGVVLPETAKEKPKIGVVISTGPGKPLENGDRLPPQLQKGDEVIFQSYAGNEIEINGEEFILMSESEIMGKVQ